MKEGMCARFTEAFKQHVVGEVEAGRISQSEANRKYGILGHSTILKWCRKYGKLPSTFQHFQQRKKQQKRNRCCKHIFRTWQCGSTFVL